MCIIPEGTIYQNIEIIRNVVRKISTIGCFVLLQFFYFTNSYSQQPEIDSISTLLKGNISDTTRILLLNSLAFNYINKDPMIAMDDVLIAHNFAREISFNKGIANTYNTLGGIKWSLAQYPEALNHYQSALKYFELTDNKIGKARCFNNIGEIYKKLREYDKTLDYLFRSIAIQKEFPKLYNATSVTLYNIGETYLLMNNIARAREYFNLILENASESDSRIQAFANAGLGDAAGHEKKYPTALEFYNKSEDLRLMRNDNRGLAELYLKKGNIYGQLEQYDSSKHYYTLALAYANQIKGKYLMMKSYQGLTKTDSSTADYHSALGNYFKYNSIKDSLYSEEKSRQLHELETEYSTDLLYKENEANLAKVKQQNTFLIGIVMIMFLSIALAGTFYKQQRNQQRVNFLLAEKNLQINDQKEKIVSQAEKLKLLNQKLEKINSDLEAEVKQRTEKLTDRNKKLAEYAYTNAHELRAPVAHILGLVNLLLNYSELNEKESEIITHLKNSTQELDRVIKIIRSKLEDDAE